MFSDSLPDEWGRLLVDRLLLKHQINPHAISALTRLAIVGSSGMGALRYVPQWEFPSQQTFDDLDHVVIECNKILNAQARSILTNCFD